ncbi:MAG: hypothetical protein LBJ63_06290 [Prevotellaceae bacterium]|jgi:hypothetical protein|nr:hypothetical protein [Prevotellaceae bacterium]
MKQEQLNYELFHPVDESTALGRFINIVFSKLFMARAISAPISYEAVKEKGKKIENHKERAALHFYDLCLGELYLHSIIDNLNRWQRILKEYNEEFQSNWRYYASSKRLDSIREYGGEADDYNDDGSIKTDVSDEELLNYSVIGDLIPDSWSDTFIHTIPQDLYPFASFIPVNEKINAFEIFEQCFGKKPTTYRMENGIMKENTFADELIHRIEREDSAELTANTLIAVCVEAIFIVCTTKELDRNKNNEGFLSKFLPAYINNLFELKIEPIQIFGTELNTLNTLNK